MPNRFIIPPAEPPRKRVVLVVEDTPLNMKLFAALIESQGYEVLEAVAGMQGVALAREHHPDLIVMDIQLPDISGYEAMRILRAEDETSAIPIIVTTAVAHHADAELLKQSKCDGFLAKPIQIAAFSDLINTLIARASAQSGPAHSADTAP